MASNRKKAWMRLLGYGIAGVAAASLTMVGGGGMGSAASASMPARRSRAAESGMRNHCIPHRRPVHVPNGEGWIAGGVYFSGGPPPEKGHRRDCVAFSVFVVRMNGRVVAHVTTKDDHGFAIVVPGGRYKLQSCKERRCPSTSRPGVVRVRPGHAAHARLWVVVR
jgi:hypothetical protein